jgi:hypothetical protein
MIIHQFLAGGYFFSLPFVIELMRFMPERFAAPERF